ncbi:hypothetical protein Tco_0929294, partial [Tanacetum coccineum]
FRIANMEIGFIWGRVQGKGMVLEVGTVDEGKSFVKWQDRSLKVYCVIARVVLCGDKRFKDLAR